MHSDSMMRAYSFK